LLVWADDGSVHHAGAACWSITAIAAGARNQTGYQAAVVAPVETAKGSIFAFYSPTSAKAAR